MLPICMYTSIQKYVPLLNSVLKYSVSFIALLYVLFRICTLTFSYDDFYEFLDPISLLLVLLLTIINWSFEILKWQLVIDTFSKISFLKASYQTLISYAYGMITPFNSGNYAKKASLYPKKHQKRVVFLNLTKGLYQLSTTIVFGFWGLYLFIDNIDFNTLKQHHFLIITTIFGIVVAFFYRQKINTFLKSISLKTHILLFLYSAIKFICFSLILVILLQKSNISALNLYAAICSIYILSSVLPILNLLDFAIKGSVALWILVPMGYNEKPILIAYFILWICNHAFPAIIGSALQLYISKNKNL